MNIRMQRLDDGRLHVRIGEDPPRTVQARRCFPWSAPERHISLRGDEDHEVVMIDDMDQLDDDSRAALQDALDETSFVFEVIGVDSMDTVFEIRNWQVRTRQGPMTFQTRLDAWPRQTPGGGMLFRDVSGNLFHFIDPHGMDEHSRRVIWAFVD